jgi:aspartate-semialdehyde dehydrogenase
VAGVVAVVGATGAVGAEFRDVLQRRGFPAREYRLLASSRSAGKRIAWIGGELEVRELGPESFRGVDLALFSAGAAISRQFAPQAVAAGAVVVDNSSAFRMDASVPLVIPEVNPQAARGHRGILAVPNCSTIILALPLWPLHRRVRVRRVVVSTYQAVSGAGHRAIVELENQTRDVLTGRPASPEVFHVPCAFNVFSHNSAIGENGFNGEEQKMADETRKIFDAPEIRVTATCVRVPVMRAHTESVAVEFEAALPESLAREILAAAPGVRVIDDRAANRFPTPLDASGGDDVLVGRIRQDPTLDGLRGLQFLCSGDQLLKGAALNAVQIAELLQR